MKQQNRNVLIKISNVLFFVFFINVLCFVFLIYLAVMLYPTVLVTDCNVGFSVKSNVAKIYYSSYCTTTVNTY